MERLGFAVFIFLFFVLIFQFLRIYQRAKLKAITSFSNKGRPSLIVVVSPQCAICPAQKKVIAKLCERYPSTLLRVVNIDATTQVEQARELSVMMVPTTFLLSPDGSIVQINNGFIAYTHLEKQINNLIAKYA